MRLLNGSVGWGISGKKQMAEAQIVHTPVFLEEVLFYLSAHSGGRYVDATADGGGHAVAIAKAIAPAGKLLALEWDEELCEFLKKRFQEESPLIRENIFLERASFAEIERCARARKFVPVAGILFDFGMSSFHLDRSGRGFSFQKDEPLDMRFSSDTPVSAADILRKSSEGELSRIFSEYGQERFARRIAATIVRERVKQPIQRTNDLLRAIHNAMPVRYRRGCIHYATRVFQALRIAVNHELENIDAGLRGAWNILEPGGRIVTITFHSLEDRCVKKFFRETNIRTVAHPVIKKPLQPEPGEVHLNSRARSARLRVFEKNL